MSAATFYSFRVGGRLTGLVRRQDGTLAYATPDGWVESPELLRHFTDPGEGDLEPVTEEQAQGLAHEYGVALDAVSA